MEIIYEHDFTIVYNGFEPVYHSKFRYAFKSKELAEEYIPTLEQRLIKKSKDSIAPVIRIEDVVIKEIHVVNSLDEIPD